LRTKYFHGVSSASPHTYSLKSQYGKIRVVYRKHPDTVGHPLNAENSASHMLSLKAQKSQESNAITVAVSRGNRMTNSIRPLNAHETRGAFLLVCCAQKLDPSNYVQMRGRQEVFRQQAHRIASHPPWAA